MNTDIDQLFCVSIQQAKILAEAVSSSNMPILGTGRYMDQVDRIQKEVFAYLTEDDLQSTQNKIYAVELTVSFLGTLARSTLDQHLDKKSVAELMKQFDEFKSEKFQKHLRSKYDVVQEMYERSVASIPKPSMKI